MADGKLKNADIAGVTTAGGELGSNLGEGHSSILEEDATLAQNQTDDAESVHGPVDRSEQNTPSLL
jgi:hypothetical protein